MVSLQQRLMAPACLHCRMSLPSSSVFSMALSVNASPALSSGHVSGYGVPVMSRPERCSLAVGRNDSNFFRGMCLTFSRNFAGRAQHRAATSARLASVEFTTEEAKIVDDVRETLDGVEVDPSKKLEGNMRRLAGSNIIMDMNMGRHHLVKSAEFIKSSPKESECPKDGLPEFALVGRSNVGKSSLINALVNRKELAQTSKRPGKTQLINHFRINNNWYLVDLPGYGYAKAPTAVRTDWNEFTKDYFLHRKTLVSVLLLVDGSIPPLKIDLDCADWLGRNKIPVTIVFTKCDRRKKRKNGGRAPAENVRDFEKQLQDSFDQSPPWIMTSSATGQGKDELLQHITRLRDYWNN
ncbi:GTP-binding protein [Marchantia polymorpha subsp. ruderalis]|uniref:EngB-type G domain-containing protein n=2 Tax=Marchantia polymorpha TaxID=3197 RepID=A0A176VHY1_MARPO|nr:hypothetical protein AXG93_4472s1010 [Marchantia polymorpha subsp. ruderalis]PTQ46074.1 hypothetical protein MARPO_0012s0036 [Marchantia polymorpha]BBN18427.1 hypothetical protein Mp_8g02390 [Marchantia polymorpha subsp. ruderalis]|eukprot:PTQ46074.1 hypothetical protein MARPO_0012s0036 [Marchantia polymorpha]